MATGKTSLPDGFTVAEPMIPCADYWPFAIPEEKLAAYRRMREEGQLSDFHCIFNSQRITCLITYNANQPHEWVREKLAGYAAEFLAAKANKKEGSSLLNPP